MQAVFGSTLARCRQSRANWALCLSCRLFFVRRFRLSGPTHGIIGCTDLLSHLHIDSPAALALLAWRLTRRVTDGLDDDKVHTLGVRRRTSPGCAHCSPVRQPYRFAVPIPRHRFHVASPPKTEVLGPLNRHSLGRQLRSRPKVHSAVTESCPDIHSPSSKVTSLVVLPFNTTFSQVISF